MTPKRRAGGNGEGPLMPPPDIGVLRERIYNAERNQLSMQGELHEIRSVMATTEDIRGLQSNIANIATKLDQFGRPQWQALSVLVTVLVVLGGLVYWPIREKQGDLAARQEKFEEKIVSRSEHENRWRGFEQADTRRKAEVDEIRAIVVPRNEVSTQVANVQRQIDEIRRDVGGVVTTRDVLQAQAKQIERLEAELRAIIGGQRNAR